ncbi:type II toxin-antitoxin system RelE/ParE family toxin [Pasteurella multocida]|uniref:type II toxin-antitoxin system RelE/ParE family toxin n=1 Tax=Pasteurella multocida TaxID=747 RepID=UPI002B46F17D|nr:type II toxin-antitoxin system RelE/ParE family toxin [Pasteurella multocida]MEB3475753.1 type II toxin-antitoxin system RelE/ParE family toxin [Pasteurella multocida]MEB3506854.1 type II toxin-antitoxin system RelE/ParE family toxin [Pasteurella multocida]WRJ99664.1 type II toxin-antitoxin system RelE/ParE family toxin [Pasteurella multocida]
MGRLREVKILSAKSAVLARINRAMDGNFRDHKSIGNGLYEMRIIKGSGYRVYYGQYGEVTYLLICGGDKSTQKSDIVKARELWKEIKQQEEVKV